MASEKDHAEKLEITDATSEISGILPLMIQRDRHISAVERLLRQFPVVAIQGPVHDLPGVRDVGGRQVRHGGGQLHLRADLLRGPATEPLRPVPG